MRRRSVRVALAATLVLACGACGKHESAPTAIGPPESDPVVAVYPAARSTRVTPETEIYADFAVDLDRATLTSVNVYLKIDAMRYPAELIWSEATRRLAILPEQALRIGRTYTVEITPRVRRADGTPLFPRGWFWQFTMTSIRPLRTPDPPTGAVQVSPFMRLRWDPNDPDAGTMIYTMFWAFDSSVVADRNVAGTLLNTNRWIPVQRWPMDTPIYWAVRAQNLRTGEILEGPVWRFRTLPASTPVEDVVLRAVEWGYATSASPGIARCNEQNIQIAPTNVAAIRWQLPPPGTAFAAVELTLTPFPNVSGSRTSIRATATSWNACAVRHPGTPLGQGPTLATMVPRSGAFLFQSDSLTAHVEAASRDGNLYGYLIESTRTISLLMLNPGDVTLGGMAIKLYRPPAPAP